jgi:hypothetical protein
MEGFEMWFHRRMERIYETHRSVTVKEERNNLHTLKGRKDNWIGHILRRNCVLKHVTSGKIEGRIEVMGRPKR